MSSSKIIKQTIQDCGIVEYNFRTIGQSGFLPPVEQGTAGFVSTAEQGSSGFVPMSMYQGYGEQANEVVEDEGPPPIEISEEELAQRISDAFNDGLKEGKELAERGLVNVFHSLRAASETIHNLRDRIFRESEDEVINLILLVARKVIIQEVAQDRSILEGVVRNALAGLSAREEVTVHINPEDYHLFTSGRDDILKHELLNERLLMKPDPLVTTGFCRIGTSMGTIDASLDGQMEQIYRTLIEQRTVVTVDTE